MEHGHDTQRRIPDGAELSDLFRAYPVAERELIAAVGVEECVIRSALDHAGMALVPAHMRPIPRFVEKLTRAYGDYGRKLGLIEPGAGTDIARGR